MLRAKWYAVLLFGFLACMAAIDASEARGADTPVDELGSIPIDLVICIDTSGSMTDLIDSARGRIWDIVTELSKAEPTPTLRVGLFSYGTPSNSTAEEGWVVKQIDLTDDLDALYAKMMALTTEGGDEFVGWVLSDAVEKMSWSTDERALRLIYVAGNESADQGAEQRNFRYVAEKAREKGILINPIYAGKRDQGVRELWDQIADHGGGAFASIDVKEGTRQIATPYDVDLLTLNGELNATYLPYGAKGAEGLANQRAQDTNAQSLGFWSCGSRVAAKGCGLYNSAEWDLLDAVLEKGFALSELKPEELPELMRSMTLDEKTAYIAGMRAVRTAVQNRIQKTNEKREEYIRADRVRSGSTDLSLDEAMIQSLRAQAEVVGFRFPVQHEATAAAPLLAFEPEPETLPESFRVNLNALMASLPTVTYKVGSYESRYQEFASELAKHTGQAINYAVGEEGFTSKSAARERVVARLEQKIQELAVVQEITFNNSPFVYGKGTGQSSSQSSQTVRYRLGGLEFPDLARAQQAVTLIAQKLEDFSSTSAHASEHAPLETAEFLRKKIQSIGETAAQVFIQSGC